MESFLDFFQLFWLKTGMSAVAHIASQTTQRFWILNRFIYGITPVYLQCLSVHGLLAFAASLVFSYSIWLILGFYQCGYQRWRVFLGAFDTSQYFVKLWFRKNFLQDPIRECVETNFRNGSYKVRAYFVNASIFFNSKTKNVIMLSI